MKDKLTPRAKIGDVVIIDSGKGPYQLRIQRAFWNRDEWYYYLDDISGSRATDKDILKNLTTNISYE